MTGYHELDLIKQVTYLTKSFGLDLLLVFLRNDRCTSAMLLISVIEITATSWVQIVIKERHLLLCQW